MFLAQLNETQKYAFAALAHAVASADNVLAQSEAEMMAQYRQEMALPSDGNTSVEEAVSCFAAAEKSVQKKVLFELLALACADSEYSPEEQQLLKRLQDVFALDDAFMAAAMEKLKKQLALYEEIGQLVNG